MSQEPTRVAATDVVLYFVCPLCRWQVRESLYKFPLLVDDRGLISLAACPECQGRIDIDLALTVERL